MIPEKKDALYYYKKIESLQKKGLWWQVVDVFEKVLLLTFQPKRELLLEYIIALKKMHRFEKVIQVYEEITLISLLSSDESFDYAYALEQSGQEELAEICYDKAIELDNSKNAKLFGGSVFYEALGDWHGASKAYEDRFKNRKLSLEMAYKQGLAYDRCYDWSKAEETYLTAILESNEPINFYHRLGIVQERQGRYDDAIESYLVAVFKHQQHLPYFYYRLGYILRKKELYKEACEAFLMMKHLFLPTENINHHLVKKNGTLLHQYLLENEPLSTDAWLKFAQKAESLKCWKVASYAHKEYLLRKEEFNGDDYFNLAKTLVYQGQYKEASKVFLEQRIIQDAHGLVETEYHQNKKLQASINYVNYYEGLALEEKFILYEGYQDSLGKSISLNFFNEITKDVHFDTYRHIWVVNRLEVIPNEVKEYKNIILLERNSNLYRRYLGSVKYIINNTKLPDYFIQKEGQFCLNAFKQYSIDTLDEVKKIFFQHHHYIKKTIDKKSILLYGGHFIPNGITTSFLNLIDAIDKENYTIYVVIDEEQLSKNEQNIEQFKRLNKEIIVLKKTSSMLTTLEEKWLISKLNLQHDLASEEMWETVNNAYRREYKHIFKRQEFDLIINFEGYSQYWLRLLASVQEIPNVLYLHNDILGEAKVRFPYLYGNMKFYKYYTKLISVSKDSHEINQKNIELDNCFFDYCNNLLNTEEIIDKSKAFVLSDDEKNIFKNSRVFINIARLSPEKGQIQLIKAFSKLAKEYSDVKLIILGQGALKENLDELIMELTLEKKIFLLGQKFNPMPYLKLSDCFVLSSNHEGQGLVLLEAMVLNKYIISTDIEGPRGVLRDNLGKLVKNSEDGLYEGMLEFLNNKKHNFKKFYSVLYNRDALDMFNSKVMILADNSKNNLDLLYQSAIQDFNNNKWKISFEKFTKLRSIKGWNSHIYPTRYYTRESTIRYLVEVDKKKIEDNLIYLNHKFNSENFAGVEFLLEKAILNSTNYSNDWRKFSLVFSTIIKYVKNNDIDSYGMLNREFLEKIESLSIVFNDTLEVNKLPYQVWFLFANLFLLTHNYRKYHLARNNALESVNLITSIPNVRIARYKINAMIELNKFQKYSSFRDKLLKRDKNYIKKNLWLLGISELYWGKQQSVVNFYTKSYTEEETKFARYIKDKSVAIVGPIEVGLDVGKEIDGFDVVVRFNYSGLSTFSKKSFGEKTNISFYISQILLNDRLDNEKIKWMNKLDWIIVDTTHQKDDLPFLGSIKPIRQRFYAGHPHANPYFKGTPSGIQRVVMDLMRFNISRLKIFNTNLFLDTNYAKSYKSCGHRGADYFNFIRHDPLSNFVFLKKLKNFSLIEVDEVLEDILKMSKKEYIDALQLQYGKK